MESLVTSLRIAGVTLLVCSGGYTAVVLGFARLAAPMTAAGSLVARPDGTIVGSHLLAQAFTEARYFWPRPSAASYNAAGAGGSNQSPTSPELTARGQQIVVAHGATAARPLPADLAAASGSGLDPHITEQAALWQVERVAAARAWPATEVEARVRRHAFAPGGFMTKDRLVNVLELNLELDRP